MVLVFLVIIAPRIISHQFCIFFIGASICQSVVVYPSMVTVTHTQTSVRGCVNVWQYWPPDL